MRNIIEKLLSDESESRKGKCLSDFCLDINYYSFNKNLNYRKDFF